MPLVPCNLPLPLRELTLVRFLGPLSELYGRKPIITGGNIVFVVFQIGCAEANSMATLIVLRLFAGIGGSAVLSVGGGVIADAFPKEKMGAATAAFAMGPLLGPVIGPVIGGFLTQALGWRWNFWLLTIFGGVVTILGLFLIPETNPHILLQRRAKKIQKETGDDQWHALKKIKESPRRLLLLSLYRPMKVFLNFITSSHG
jgi:multidrug resistance protein